MKNTILSILFALFLTTTAFANGDENQIEIIKNYENIEAQMNIPGYDCTTTVTVENNVQGGVVTTHTTITIHCVEKQK